MLSIEEFIIKSLIEFHLKSHMVWMEIKMKVLNVLDENFQTHLKYYSFLGEGTKDRYAFQFKANTMMSHELLNLISDIILK